METQIYHENDIDTKSISESEDNTVLVNKNVFYCTYSYRHCKNTSSETCTLVNAILVPISQTIASHFRAESYALSEKMDGLKEDAFLKEFKEELNDTQDNTKGASQQSSLIFILYKNTENSNFSNNYEVLFGSHRFYASYLAKHSPSDIDERTELSFLIDSTVGNIIRFRKCKAYSQTVTKTNLNKIDIYGCLTVTTDETAINICEISKGIGHIVNSASKREIIKQKRLEESCDNSIVSTAGDNKLIGLKKKYFAKHDKKADKHNKNAKNEKSYKIREIGKFQEEISITKDTFKTSIKTEVHERSQPKSTEKTIAQFYEEKTVTKSQDQNKNVQKCILNGIGNSSSDKNTNRQRKDKEDIQDSSTQSQHSSSVPVTSLSDVSCNSLNRADINYVHKKEILTDKTERSKKFQTFTKHQPNDSKIKSNKIVNTKKTKKLTQEHKTKDGFFSTIGKFGQMGESKLLQIKKSFHRNKFETNKNKERSSVSSCDQDQERLSTDCSIATIEISRNKNIPGTKFSGHLTNNSMSKQILRSSNTPKDNVEEIKTSHLKNKIDESDTFSRLQRPRVIKEMREANTKLPIRQSPATSKRHSSLPTYDVSKRQQSHTSIDHKFSPDRQKSTNVPTMQNNKGDHIIKINSVPSPKVASGYTRDQCITPLMQEIKQTPNVQIFYCTSCGFLNMCSTVHNQELPLEENVINVSHQDSPYTKASLKSKHISKPPRPMHNQPFITSPVRSERHSFDSLQNIRSSRTPTKGRFAQQSPTRGLKSSISNTSINSIAQSGRKSSVNRLPRYTIVKKTAQQNSSSNRTEPSTVFSGINNSYKIPNRSKQEYPSITAAHSNNLRMQRKPILASPGRTESIVNPNGNAGGIWPAHSSEDQMRLLTTAASRNYYKN